MKIRKWISQESGIETEFNTTAFFDLKSKETKPKKERKGYVV
jgi:hypothetical protein